MSEQKTKKQPEYEAAFNEDDEPYYCLVDKSRPRDRWGYGPPKEETGVYTEKQLPQLYTVVLKVHPYVTATCCGVTEIGSFYKGPGVDFTDDVLNIFTDHLMKGLEKAKTSLAIATFVRDITEERYDEETDEYHEEETDEYNFDFLKDNLIKRHGWVIVRENYPNLKYDHGHMLTTICKHFDGERE